MKMDMLNLYVSKKIVLTVFYVLLKYNFIYISFPFIFLLNLTIHWLFRLCVSSFCRRKILSNEWVISYVGIARLFDCYFIYNLSKCMCLRTKLYTNDKSKQTVYAKMPRLYLRYFVMTIQHKLK